MIVSEILTSVKRMFGDEAGVQVDDSDIIRWINQGMRQIVMQNESLLLVGDQTANAVAGTAVYSFPSDMLILRGIKYKDVSSGQYYGLTGYDLTKFNDAADGWDGDPQRGTPAMYAVTDTASDPQKFSVWPVPLSSLTAGFKFAYNRMPTAVTSENDTPELPLLYHEVLVKHCMQQAYELDEDWDAAGNKASELDRDINLLRGREDWKTQEKYPTITVLAEDSW